MTDRPVPRPTPAGPNARARAMDEALDWLVRLQCADAQDTQAFEAWLSDDNQDAEGRQRRSLTQVRESLPR